MPPWLLKRNDECAVIEAESCMQSVSGGGAVSLSQLRSPPTLERHRCGANKSSRGKRPGVPRLPPGLLLYSRNSFQVRPRPKRSRGPAHAAVPVAWVRRSVRRLESLQGCYGLDRQSPGTLICHLSSPGKRRRAFLSRPLRNATTSRYSLIHEICSRDLEGIVAKRSAASYRASRSEWLRIKNRSYSQAEG